MIIDVKNMDAAMMPNFKGGEKEMAAKMFFDGKNRVLHGTLQKGASIGYHAHETNSEILYVLSGKGRATIDGVEEMVEAGQVHYCPKGHSHGMVNDWEEPLVFFAVVPEQ
ncbi:MAG: cupin domain-containing protein [Fibrobacteraceae bacterium]|nr:cupin domain-containing protein [Fibrobacteraceae bacterium]